MDAAMVEIDSDSNRCEPPMITAMPMQIATGSCTQGACGNGSKTPYAVLPNPQPTKAVPPLPFDRLHSPFAWNKIHNVPLERMSREHFFAKDGTTIELELNSVKDNIAKLDMAIVAKLMGRRISFPFILQELKRRWFHFGEFEIITMGPNTFMTFAKSFATNLLMTRGNPRYSNEFTLRNPINLEIILFFHLWHLLLNKMADFPQFIFCPVHEQ
ncbi:hypothetical protein MA16_Dca025995 [Dendrobium catenatum]|uniref:DUF4283 domain-containing protein n=1 Tax=Dendrobium catenatum TaxID=906689 RepID=A0A2I0WP56_9ASPA|nr:hypothetical protein MA16_Dca025995 [Dendrobium catenatum]